MFGSITNWESDLFDQFDRLKREMEDIWGSPGGPASIRASASGSYPAINVGSTAEGIDVFVFAPGLDRDRIDVSVQQNLLSISGESAPAQPEKTSVHRKERFSGQFRRSLSLPEDIDPDSATASYRNGVLHLGFKRKAEAKPRKIQINQ
jgi:HSP20 family protein